MTETLTKIVANCTTKEVQIVPLSAEELSQREIDVAAFEARQAEREAAEAAKALAKASANAKLAALGLTPEEIAAL